MIVWFIWCVVATAALQPLQETEYRHLFHRFASQFHKQYSSDSEATAHYLNFKHNVDLIRQHNQQQDASFELGINQFADLNSEQMRQNYLGLNGESQKSDDPLLSLGWPGHALHSVDWRDRGIVTSVKAQGLCGSW